MPEPTSARPSARSASIRWRPRSARSSSSTRPSWRSTSRASSSVPAGSRARATTRSSSCARSCRPSCRTDLRRSASFRVEVDALPGGYVCSATLKGALRPTDVTSAVRGRDARCASSSRRSSGRSSPRTCRRGSGSTTCRSSGRSSCSSCGSRPESSSRRLVAEMWLYPDGSRMLELSTRCGTTEAFQVAAEIRAFLASRAASTSPASRRRRPARRSTTSRALMADAAG